MSGWRLGVLLLLVSTASAQAEVPALGKSQQHTFALIGKSDDGNFIAAGRGCAEQAQRNGDVCVLLANSGGGHPRLQERVVLNALKSQRYHALALSVTKSDMIAWALGGATIPVVTYDSPFAAPDGAIARRYLGIDNIEAGRQLARITRQLRPTGGSVCLMTSAHDQNLAQRVAGIRQELSGNPDFPEGQTLQGEGGWTESARCPWNTGDNVKRAMSEVHTTLASVRPDVLLSVGDWPVVDARAYRKVVHDYRDDLKSKRTIVVMASGALSPDRLALMDEKLVHGYVVIDFVQLGKRCYDEMKAAVMGEPVRVAQELPVSVMVEGRLLR